MSQEKIFLIWKQSINGFNGFGIKKENITFKALGAHFRDIAFLRSSFIWALYFPFFLNKKCLGNEIQTESEKKTFK